MHGPLGRLRTEEPCKDAPEQNERNSLGPKRRLRRVSSGKPEVPRKGGGHALEQSAEAQEREALLVDRENRDQARSHTTQCAD